MSQNNYLESTIRQFNYYKKLGERTFEQLNEKDIHWQFNEDSNSIAIIVKHIVGNQLSRWTNFLTEDGEKDWRKRDSEFEDTFKSKVDMLLAWNKGWNCLFDAITNLNEQNLKEVVYIRNQGHTVVEAINRQLSHYPYHVGQLVYIAKMIKGNDWESLSIPKNNSKNYNATQFSKEKSRKHFTDDL